MPIAQRWLSGTSLILCTLLTGAVAAQAQKHKHTSATAGHDAAYYAFRDAAVGPGPSTIATPHFKLSHNYPRTAPQPCPDSECTWLKIPVNFTPSFPAEKNLVQSPKWHGQHYDEYITAVLDYVKQGQDANLDNQKGWQINVDGKTRWYNVPWMAYDPTAGREYIHGTTNERTAPLDEFIDHTPVSQLMMAGETEECKKSYPYGFESWSVGYYNEYGGYALSQAVPASGVPQVGEYLGNALPAGLPFPTGTVVVKILTSSVPESCVPFLHGSPAWQIDRHRMTGDKGYVCDREVQISHVVQVDVAVVDPRSPSRWVYGTFAYDGQVKGTNFWDHLVPVGLQWGSDPWSFPAVPKPVSLPLQESAINTDIQTFQHLGCLDRLAGPVDNPESSCTSCHSSAYAVPRGNLSKMGLSVPPSFGFSGMCQAYSQENADYFQNQQAPQQFPGGNYTGAISMDTSLQLAVAFTQYGVFHTDHQPNACTNPNQLGPKKLNAQKLNIQTLAGLKAGSGKQTNGKQTNKETK